MSSSIYIASYDWPKPSFRCVEDKTVTIYPSNKTAFNFGLQAFKFTGNYDQVTLDSTKYKPLTYTKILLTQLYTEEYMHNKENPDITAFLLFCIQFPSVKKLEKLFWYRISNIFKLWLITIYRYNKVTTDKWSEQHWYHFMPSVRKEETFGSKWTFCLQV